MVAEMCTFGLGLDRFRALTEWIAYRLLESATPESLRLATAAAIEHHNAVIACSLTAETMQASLTAPACPALRCRDSATMTWTSWRADSNDFLPRSAS